MHDCTFKLNNLLRLWNDFPFQLMSSSSYFLSVPPSNHMTPILDALPSFHHPINSQWIKSSSALHSQWIYCFTCNLAHFGNKMAFYVVFKPFFFMPEFRIKCFFSLLIIDIIKGQDRSLFLAVVLFVLLHFSLRSNNSFHHKRKWFFGCFQYLMRWGGLEFTVYW